MWGSLSTKWGQKYESCVFFSLFSVQFTLRSNLWNDCVCFRFYEAIPLGWFFNTAVYAFVKMFCFVVDYVQKSATLLPLSHPVHPICTSIPSLLFAPPAWCEFKPAGSWLPPLCVNKCVCVVSPLLRLLNEGAWRHQALHRADTPKPGGEGPEAHLRAVRQDLRVDGDKGQIHGDAQRWAWLWLWSALCLNPICEWISSKKIIRVKRLLSELLPPLGVSKDPHETKHLIYYWFKDIPFLIFNLRIPSQILGSLTCA